MARYRTYASFFALVTIAFDADLAFRITAINISSVPHHIQVLSLSHRHVEMCMGPYRERLENPRERQAFFRAICQKLYVEYTSRSLEVLFPGLKPKGALRRHPAETAMLQQQAQFLSEEHEKLQQVRQLCVRQAAAVALRRLEQYLARQQVQRKKAQEQAVVKIQARARGMIAKKVARERKRLQDLSASMIQQVFRRRKERERVNRLRCIQQHNVMGVSFRFACRINNTFLVISALLDEIDGDINWFHVTLRACHPVSDATASLRILHSELLVALQLDTLQFLTRRAILEQILVRHLDVFRSAKHNLLVLSLRQPVLPLPVNPSEALVNHS
ncbi:TPA: LOW QUALITY PROTEIN: hypothetical protein N0F65_000225 [Lagenidium giganteum]|uniref:Uncharacterized protein n=1 Tax=Lagenidium giganteum TaxID=4803 RepID=A0AAV2YE44_9STRA|nr:TPA: LOW QUALITY PROTEIN: hypothetical protein N0F65_000225 [Lagenidium giganteum]